MKYLLSILLLSAAMQAQNFNVNRFALPDAPSQHPQHPFWTIENKVSFSVLAGLVAAGEAAGSALGFGAAVGAVYLLHHSHHYRAERVTMRLFVAGESGFVANN